MALLSERFLEIVPFVEFYPFLTIRCLIKTRKNWSNKPNTFQEWYSLEQIYKISDEDDFKKYSR